MQHTHTHTYRYAYALIITSTLHTHTKATLSEEVQSWLKPFLLKVGLEDAEFPDLEDATTDNSMHTNTLSNDQEMTTQTLSNQSKSCRRDAMPGIVCTTTHYNASAQTTFRTLRT